MPGPIDTVAKRSAMRCSSSSCTRSSTSTRDPAEQVCPAFCKIAFADHGGRPLDVGVAEHQVRRLAAELQRHRRHPPGGRARDQAADLGRADEAEVVDARVGGQRGPGLRPEPGDHVDHAGRQARLGCQPGEVDRRARRLVGRLEHRAVPGGDGRGHRPAEQLHRVVPGDDVAGDAERLAAGVHVQVRPQRDAQAVVRLDDVAVEAEVARAHPGVVARLRQRLAAVLALQPGERLDLARRSGRPAATADRTAARGWWPATPRLARRAAVTAWSISLSPARATSPRAAPVDGSMFGYVCAELTEPRR